MRRSFVAATVVAVAAVVLVLAPAGALAESSSPSPAADEVIYRIGTTQDFDGFNPFTAWSGITWDSFRLCYDFLTWYKPDASGGFDVAPDLATSWKTSANGKVWTFTIRSGMKWHDGVPLTARDIAFTYDWIIQTRNTTYIQYLVGVTSVEAPDDATLVITCERPNAGMLALYIPILPEHVWKKYADRDAMAMESYRNLPLIGSGPFQVTEVKKSEYVKLSANPGYPAELGGPPRIDALMYVISQNVDAMVQDYKARNLDAILDWPAVYYNDLKDEAGSSASKAPAIGFHELGFNCWKSDKSKGNPLLRDVAVRQAVNWAIDKQAIVAASMGGLAIPGTSLISPVQGVWHWDVPEDGRYRFDPEKAKQILEDAGYTDKNGDGVRENARGDRLEFRLVALNEYPEDQAAAKKIVSWCGGVGIKLDLDQKDEAAFGREVYDNADYDMFIWSWGGDIDPGFMLSTFTSEQILNWGDSQYSNPEYDRLYDKQAQAVDPEKPGDPTARKAITDQMQAILYRDSPYSILWYKLNLQAWRTDTWAGYHLVPEQDGAPLWNMMRTTYIDLHPKSATEAASSGSSAWIVALVITVAVVAGVVVLLLRRRPEAVED